IALLAQSSADFPTVDLGHHQVENEQVRLGLADFVQGFAAVARRLHGEAFGLEIHARELEDVLFVVGDEDGSHLAVSFHSQLAISNQQSAISSQQSAGGLSVTEVSRTWRLSPRNGVWDEDGRQLTADG